ncbi:hypothetical protein BFJ72_g11094 [Fusarium proliferatum]|uniref:Uncharacterized protein n=1 Tax=Gibberella intermedia TaxID=948311 RepID=A0A420SQF1_GIBIN|nr:hypothetical protein BFJ72_g11094 [Fusarium proliferatum]
MLYTESLGHAVKIASYESSDEVFGHLRGFNETVLGLAGPLSTRFYGPLVALAYNLDSRFHFETMDDVSSADFGALVDVFQKSDWNPAVGRVEGYPRKTISALFLPDVFDFHRMHSSHTEKISESPDELSIHRLIGTQDTVVEVNIAATLDSKQLCEHRSCYLDAISTKELCLNGQIFHSLRLGPLLLDLPWIGKVARFTDHHIDTPEYRWQESRCRFLRRAIVLGYKLLGVDHVPEKDGIIVFSAFGVKISPLHLIAYDEYMFRQLQTDKSKRQLSKAGFLSFWNDLKSGKVKITNELKKPQYVQLDLLEFWGDSRLRETQTMTHAELDFSEESSPYDTPTDAKYILTEDETQVFLHIRKLFRDPDFVRPNQRDWLEVLYDANTLVQDRKLGPDYWADELDKFFTDYLSSLAQD